LHDLLLGIESITACRDRESLATHLLRSVRALLGTGQIVLLDVDVVQDSRRTLPIAEATADGVRFLRSEAARACYPLAAPQSLIARTLAGAEAVLDETDAGFHCVFPLRPLNLTSSSGCLAISAARPASAAEIEALSWFVRIYGNYIGLLDYSEFDTLTRLLNRKTFDDAFERLLAQTQQAQVPSDAERRSTTADSWWLAVVDIDHFKRVNDTYGHLFGDEVLLRIANLMRDCFRGYDLLFRFGGEEFVVMLQTASRHGAEIALDRFRRAVEGYEFPQVGRVTCSVGFTAVDAMRAQTDMLGEADAALYWCKSHGRNRVGCYEALVDSGDLAPKRVDIPQPDFDIDALFS
jgi:diguanylate cyclase (GGDEF)-like protein